MNCDPSARTKKNAKTMVWKVVEKRVNIFYLRTIPRVNRVSWPRVTRLQKTKGKIHTTRNYETADDQIH